MFNAQDDPLGLGLAQRARARRMQETAVADVADDQRALMASGQSGPQVALGAMQSQFERARSNAALDGYNSDWDKFFQSLREQQDDAEANGMKFKVDARGLGNPAMESLQPVPESYDSWSASAKDRIYGKGKSYAGDPSMSSLNRGR